MTVVGTPMSGFSGDHSRKGLWSNLQIAKTIEMSLWNRFCTAFFLRLVHCYDATFSTCDEICLWFILFTYFTTL